MNDKQTVLRNILQYVADVRYLDIAGYHTSLVERYIARRLRTIGLTDYGEYLHYFLAYPAEQDELTTNATATFGRFFRNPLALVILAGKIQQHSYSIQVWSAGCAADDCDLVLGYNVLIYFNIEYRKIIFDKLYRSLAKYGYLGLGKTETLPQEYQHAFDEVISCCRIFQKGS